MPSTVMVPPLGLIFLELGTIFIGVATPTEGGAMGAAGAMILALMKGRLSFFVPEEEVAHIQVPPSRTTMALRFNQFRSLHLTRVFKPKAATLDEARMPAAREQFAQALREVYASGEWLLSRKDW